jgi:ERCC4-related helicase
MIFSQYRESVYEITEMLSAHGNVIKAMEFVGQSVAQNGTGQPRKSVTQKEQLEAS